MHFKKYFLFINSWDITDSGKSDIRVIIMIIIKDYDYICLLSFVEKYVIQVINMLNNPLQIPRKY